MAQPKTGLWGSGRLRIYALLWAAAFLTHFSWQSFDFSIACIRHDSEDDESANALLHAALNETVEGDWSWLGPAFASWSLGTLLFDLPAGYLVDWLGVRLIFGGGLMAAAVFNAVLPSAIRVLPLVCALRFLSGGTTQGIRWCAQNSAAGKWAPVNELGLIMGLGSAAATAGSMLANALGALLCTQPRSPGWPLLFYLCSALMALWVALWFYLFRERPEWDARVSEEEAELIQEGRNFKPSEASTPNLRPLEGRRVPWRHIATSLPLWAAGSCGFANAWLTALTVTYGPTFFQSTTTPSLLLNGLYASLPLLGNLLVKLLCGFSSDLSLRYVSRTRSLKLYTLLALGCVSGTLAVGSLVMRDGARHNAAVLVASYSVQGAVIAGAFKSPVLLAPRYAGVLTGLMEVCSSLGAVASLNTISALTSEAHSARWPTVFAVSSAVAAAAALLFTLFGSGDTQPWNAPLFANPALASALNADAGDSEGPALKHRRSPAPPDLLRLASVEHTM